MENIENLDELPWNPQQDRRPLSDQVHDWLRLGIVTLKFKPSAMLSESNLAKYLGTSRTPVREALIRLSQEGMVEILAQRGSRVAAISVTSVRNARFVRLALESAIAKDLCKKDGLSPASYHELQALIFRQKEAADKGLPEEFMKLDDEFHQKISVASGRAAVWNLVEREKAQMDRVVFLSLFGTSDLNGLVAQHEQILDALNNKDCDKAEALLDVHFGAVLKAMEELGQQYPDYFEQ
ncbi:MAG: GntR family transcriptional regulator [Alphaproteobacteria bacterium]